MCLKFITFSSISLLFHYLFSLSVKGGGIKGIYGPAIFHYGIVFQE